MTSLQRAAMRSAVALGALLWTACSDRVPDAFTGPSARTQAGGGPSSDVRAAIAAQERHTAALLRIPGVVGTAVGRLPSGQAAVRIFLATPGVGRLPTALDGVPVAVEVTGLLVAFSDPTTRQRPAPLGFSVGHPSITAGTIGARVVDGAGNVFVLSNNHVLANGNEASVGDPALQPGPFDGGTAADQIGTLFAFQPIDFSLGGSNTIDAAIALSSATELGNATPADDGYGAPGATIFGDANGDDVFDDRAALLGLTVQKYGRTTKRTHGQVTGINATVDICYEVLIIFCVKSARFVDQLIIEPGSFSGGGDSGSLIVSDDATASPVGLLFAGSSAQTIANRIDLVLNHFGVRVDGAGEPPPPPPPPTPTTDIGITSITAPASVTQGAVVSVTVTVRNVGNQDVSVPFDVTVEDATDNVALGAQSVAGLAAGASTTLAFAWNTTGSSVGSHSLSASHSLTDDDATNNTASTTAVVNAPSTAIHVGDLDAFPSNDGSSWSAVVEIAVHDGSHNPINGATVTGTWSRAGLNADTCTTGELGGDGTCIVLFPGLKKNVRSVTFTVTSVTMSGRTYQASDNHDVDGDSNGTSIQVNKP